VEPKILAAARIAPAAARAREISAGPIGRVAERIVQAVAREHRHGPLRLEAAVAEQTALAIAVFLPVADSVRVIAHLVAADMAEAPLAPRARAEEAAWAAADLAAAADVAAEEADAVAAAVDAAAEEAEAGGVRIHEVKQMKTKLIILTSTKIFLITIGIGCLVDLAVHAAPEAKKDAAPSSQQKQFNTPKEAADSLVQATATFDVAYLKEILGPDATDLVSSADPVADKNKAEWFATKAKDKINIGTDPKNPNQAIITVGNDDFPLPIPLMKKQGKWIFDTKVGKEEILNRRIGSNELDAIAICRGFVEAQQQYAQEKHDDAKVNQYAQKIVSTPGKHDGLAWQNADGTWGGPVGQGIARALEQGYTQKSQPQPYHGYYFKVLKGQGPAAPMGQMDFVIDGAMIAGFALAAAPAQYRVTGVKTFIVGPNGMVYEKDLGPDTLKTFQDMERYNPEKGWRPTDDEWPADEPATTLIEATK
jgi:Protein of unknown function (DUF2950)